MRLIVSLLQSVAYSLLASDILRNKAALLFNAPARPAGTFGVLLVQRHGTRGFCQSREILEVLQTAYRGHILNVYEGNESVRDTIRLFYQADIVLGYHGAGLTNLMWSRKSTIALEWSLFSTFESQTTKTYRTMMFHLCRALSIQCFTMNVPLEDGLSQDELLHFAGLEKEWRNASTPIYSYEHPANSFLHGLKCITMPRAVLLNSAELTLSASTFALTRECH